MRKKYDFSNAMKNPHAGKFKDGYTIVVEHKDYDEIIKITKEKKVKSESLSGEAPPAIAPVSNV